MSSVTFETEYSTALSGYEAWRLAQWSWHCTHLNVLLQFISAILVSWLSSPATGVSFRHRRFLLIALSVPMLCGLHCAMDRWSLRMIRRLFWCCCSLTVLYMCSVILDLLGFWGCDAAFGRRNDLAWVRWLLTGADACSSALWIATVYSLAKLLQHEGITTLHRLLCEEVHSTIELRCPCNVDLVDGSC